MSRGLYALGRPLAVWLVVTGGAVAAVASTPSAWRSVEAGTGAGSVTDGLVALCTAALAAALVRLWVTTTVVVVGLLAGRPQVRRGVVRRLVLVACGAAVVAGGSAPALAVDDHGPSLLAGLSLPERAVAPTARPRPHPEAEQARVAAPTRPAPGPGTYRVRPGDSLWSIALDHPGDGTTDERWRAIWHANGDVVGDDPDLILPGQALRLPGTTTDHDTDGDR